MAHDADKQPWQLAFRTRSWEFRAGWLPTLVTILFLTLLINLGQWQTERGDYKQAVLDRMAERQDQTETFTSLLSHGDDSMDFPLSLRGEFLHERTFLLDNRTFQGHPGYEVITPLVTHGHTVLVNRGWVAMGRSRDDIAPYPQPQGPVDITGTTHVPNPDFFVLKEDDYSEPTWPFVIQKIHLPKTAPLFDMPLAPFIIREAPSDGSGFERHWHSSAMTPEKHYGYALQWYSLALALCVIYVVVNVQRLKGKQTDDVS